MEMKNYWRQTSDGRKISVYNPGGSKDARYQQKFNVSINQKKELPNSSDRSAKVNSEDSLLQMVGNPDGCW